MTDLTMSDLVQIVAGLLVVGGAAFCFIAALGILRLQDVIIRMHAASKAGTLGSGMVMVAVALHFGGVDVVARAILCIVFLVITAPVASHMIGRAAYALGVKLWSGTIADELKGKYVLPPADTPRTAMVLPRRQPRHEPTAEG